MTEQECLEKMVAPGTRRPGKYRDGVIQINVTSACNLSCFNCTQGSNFGGPKHVMSSEHFRQAVMSLGFQKGDGGKPPFKDAEEGRYYGVVGVFGGNPAMSPHFQEYCHILRHYVPFQQRGLWCNHPRGKGREMRATFDPAVSNLNVHLDQEAYQEFVTTWPECRPVGNVVDSRHSPVFVAMKDVVKKKCDHIVNERDSCQFCENGQSVDESRIWELISNCDINQHWSAMIGLFRGELRAWFCEIAGAQSMLHQAEQDYPDTGYPLDFKNGHNQSWWQLGIQSFKDQVRKHCFDCGVPLRGYGELAQGNPTAEHTPAEQVSLTHASIARPKKLLRPVEIVTDLVQLGTGRISSTIKYLQNAGK